MTSTHLSLWLIRAKGTVVMWLFTKKKEERAAPPVSEVSGSDWWGAFRESSTGITVTAENAMECSAVWAGVNFIADTIASLPLHVFRKKQDENMRVSLPVSALLNDAPNPGLTSYRWRSDMMANTLLYGRSYTWIQRKNNGSAAALWPMDPTRVRVERVGLKKRYIFSGASGEVIYAEEDVIDIPVRLRADGLSHHDPMATLRNAVGLALAQEKFASRRFANGGVPELALRGPIATGEGVMRATLDLQRAVLKAHATTGVLTLPLGHEVVPIGTNPESMQLVDSRRFQIEEIARILGIPPLFLQDLSKGTYANTEQQDLHVVKHTLTRWVKSIEQELNLKLFYGSSLFAEFSMAGLLRGDFKARMDGYATAIQNGVLTPNEVRKMENKPRVDGADDLLIQGATVPLGYQKHVVDTQQGVPTSDQGVPQDGGN